MLDTKIDRRVTTGLWSAILNNRHEVRGQDKLGPMRISAKALNRQASSFFVTSFTCSLFYHL
jgi:hypothetical protein